MVFNDNEIDKKISSSIISNKEYMKKRFNNSCDLVSYEFTTISGFKFLLVYIADIVNKDIINYKIFNKLNCIKSDSFFKKETASSQTVKSLLGLSEIKFSDNYSEIENSILDGFSILFNENSTQALILNTIKLEKRSITEPGADTSVRGSKEGFIESLVVNRSLLRKNIKNPNLVFETLTIGKETSTIINIAYLKNIVDMSTLEELKSRLKKIDIDSILDSNYLESLISDFPLSPFRTIGYSERPDTIAGKILEGRIAILCDNSPSVLTVPYLFLEDFQSVGDYYQNYIFASINRLLRYLGFFITITIPGIYIALTTFHQEMIPDQLILSIISARQNVPLPTAIEVFGMILIFELLREASVRMPTALGQTISIVGALVLGQAAVEAKFVSAPVVIIVAVTGITSFIFYKQEESIVIIRLVITILSAILGLYGFIMGIIALFLVLIYHKSFGIPYLSFFNLSNLKSKKDVFIRAPWKFMTKNSKSLKTNVKRK